MAAVEALPCRFCWHIYNPFVPWRRMVTTFYNGSPTLTQWQVTLDPSSFQVDTYPFKFSLRNIQPREGDDVIVADEVRVYISINGRQMETKEGFGYSFSSANWYTYEFQTRVITSPLPNMFHLLLIEVQLSFPNQNLVDQGNETLLVFDDNDLKQLSEDMRRIYHYSQDFDLWLSSKPPLRIFGAHSCIMHARWSNFFEEHPVERMDNNRVEMNISPIVLSAVLLYMYSGLIDTNGPHWGNIHIRTEFFQVIDWYKLHHLYRVFAHTANSQERMTNKHLIMNIKNFLLGGLWLPLEDPPFSCTFNSGSDYELDFKIQFFLTAPVPWFLYTLCSKSSRRIYAQVILEFKKLGRDGPSDLVHGRDYTIDSNEPVASGTCHFPGDCSNLNDFINDTSRGILIRGSYSIVCYLYQSDGTSVLDITTEGVRDQDTAYQKDSERFNVLSDHMHELVLRPAHSDLRVMCPAENPRDPNMPNDPYFLHKSIFAFRLPKWRDVIQNALEGNDIPDLAMCDIRSEAFRPVHTYIYTGKMPPFPPRYLDDIYDFVNRGGLDSLSSLVLQMIMNV